MVNVARKALNSLLINNKILNRKKSGKPKEKKDRVKDFKEAVYYLLQKQCVGEERK